MDKHDRLTITVCVTANKALTQKQWKDVQRRFAESVENTIAESEDLTKKIGHVHCGSPWDSGIEICP
jgi:hypothetical protein